MTETRGKLNGAGANAPRPADTGADTPGPPPVEVVPAGSVVLPVEQPSLRELPEGAQMIGWREWLAIPEWGIARIKAKIDTGARTSSVHAEHLHFFRRRGKDMVRFRVHPRQHSLRHTVVVEAEMVDKRIVRSSSGEDDLRPVVVARVELYGTVWPVEVTLARRTLMGFRMLIGREAMWNRFVVDPSRSFLGGQPTMPLAESRVRVDRSIPRENKSTPQGPGNAT